MSLDIGSTVSSTFDRIASKASIGVIGLLLGLLLVIGAGIIAVGAAASVSPVLAAVAGVAVAAIYIAGAASFMVGSLRAFDEENIEKEMFTENIIWPFLRMTGSNIVLQAFIFIAVYLVLYPVLLAGMGSSLATGAEAPALSSTGYAALAVSTGIVIAVALYVVSALSLSLPRISVNDKRLFQSLDESVQATSGERARIIAAILPFAILLGAGVAALTYIGGALGGLIYTVSIAIGSLYWLALLVELNERL
ncbi:MAG: hypothetical protein ACLFTA_03730 [Candidatus Nanohaloarchaea archaeon]